jgi:hypothetical protein
MVCNVLLCLHSKALCCGICCYTAVARHVLRKSVGVVAAAWFLTTRQLLVVLQAATAAASSKVLSSISYSS